MPLPYADRGAAGRALAASLAGLAGEPGLIVLGLPRGGVPVAAEVAAALEAPLDVFVVRKLGLPVQPELAMGAIASGGVRVLNIDVLEAAGVPAAVLEQVTERERAELEARERRYRGDRPPLRLEGATAILVDDGLATGASMRAAVDAARAQGAARVVAAAPVASPATTAGFADAGIELVVAAAPAGLHAVGAAYLDFRPVPDEQVVELLVPDRTRRVTLPP